MLSVPTKALPTRELSKPAPDRQEQTGGGKDSGTFLHPADDRGPNRLFAREGKDSRCGKGKRRGGRTFNHRIKVGENFAHQVRQFTQFRTFRKLVFDVLTFGPAHVVSEETPEGGVVDFPPRPPLGLTVGRSWEATRSQLSFVCVSPAM